MKKMNARKVLPIAMFAIISAFVTVACTDQILMELEDGESFSTLRADNATFNVLPSADTSGNVDSTKFCFDINFPVNLVYPDGNVASLSSDAEFLTAIESWKLDNPENDVYPELEFPITVTMADGTTQNLNDAIAASQLFRDCFKDHPDFKDYEGYCEGGNCGEEEED